MEQINTTFLFSELENKEVLKNKTILDKLVQEDKFLALTNLAKSEDSQSWFKEKKIISNKGIELINNHHYAYIYSIIEMHWDNKYYYAIRGF